MTIELSVLKVPTMNLTNIDLVNDLISKRETLIGAMRGEWQKETTYTLFCGPLISSEAFAQIEELGKRDLQLRKAEVEAQLRELGVVIDSYEKVR